MKITSYSAWLLFLVVWCSCGENDDDVQTPLLSLGRFDGWQIAAVESDLAGQLAAAVAQIPDTTLARYDTTRAALLRDQDDYVLTVTGVEACEADDALFFESGVLAYGTTGELCAAGSLPHILSPFQNKTYSSDLEVTRLTVVDPVREVESEYDVLEVNEDRLVLTQERSVGAGALIPAYTYSITYRFVAR